MHADKEKVHGDRTLGNIAGNNNKDAMFDLSSGCQSEDKQTENIIGCYFPNFTINFIAFVCILYQVIFACCAGMFVWF